MPPVIRPLSRSYACRWGAPIIDHVDTAIFVCTYFMDCMKCTYCHDSCCQYGTDIDCENVARIEARSGELESYTGVPRERWWSGQWSDDAEFPGGRHTRTRVEDGACVFRNRRGRGCMLHSYALEQGLDYHELKPMVSALFPVTFDRGLLHPSNEIADRTLQCIDDGPTLYRGARAEVAWYFGGGLVAELDAIELGALAGSPEAK
jgi:hypothetical protein